MERKHNDLAAYCSLYDREPHEVAEFLSKIKVGHVRKLTPEGCGLFLRYVKKIQAKDKDLWFGPYLSIRKIGRRIVQALNLDTKKKAVVHLNELKELKRPSLASVSVKAAVLDLIEKNEDLSDLRDKIVWNSSDGTRMKKSDVWFLDLCDFEEFLPIVASGSCKTDMLVSHRSGKNTRDMILI